MPRLPPCEAPAGALPEAARTLAIDFPSARAFREEYLANLCKGGLFVPTGEAFELRELVRVRLQLSYCDVCLDLDGEVVHRRPGDDGGEPGVAVHFAVGAPALRERLLPLVEVEPEVRASGSPGRTGAASGPVPTLLDTTDAGQRLRVRDLSATGALVCTGGAAVAVGERVRLRLAPPGGEVFDIEGAVVHHFETDGGTTAMGIHFDPGPEVSERLVAYAEAARAAEQARRMSAISGPIEHVGLANLLQLLGSCAKLGTLIVVSGAREGRVALEDGQLRYARLGCVSGLKALARMLTWGEGSFEFHAGLEAGAPEDAPLPLAAAVFEAARQIDELARVDRRPFPPAGILAVDRERWDAEASGLDKAESAVVELALAGFRIQRIADVVPVSDAEVYAALHALVERGILSPPA